MDFRSEAAEATLAALRTSPGRQWYEMEISGCVPVPGGRMLHCATEIPAVLLSATCCLFVPILAVLSVLGTLPAGLFVPLCLVNMVMVLCAGTFQWMFINAGLARRTGSLVASGSILPKMNIKIEDGASHEKIKIVTEDAGVCFLDANQRRLLIDGCAYRYVIRAEDVLSVQSVSAFAKSATRLVCRMSGRKLDIVFDGTTAGAAETFTNSFLPRDGANSLARNLNRTLFDHDAPTYMLAEED